MNLFVHDLYWVYNALIYWLQRHNNSISYWVTTWGTSGTSTCENSLHQRLHPKRVDYQLLFRERSPRSLSPILGELQSWTKQMEHLDHPPPISMMPKWRVFRAFIIALGAGGGRWLSVPFYCLRLQSWTLNGTSGPPLPPISMVDCSFLFCPRL